MKLTDLSIISSIEVSINDVKKQEYRLLKKHKPTIDAYKIFEYNTVTNELIEATFREDDTYYLNQNAVKRLLRNDIIVDSR